VCWIVAKVSETTNSTSATNTTSNLTPHHVQIDFSSILPQLTVATSATSNLGNINIEQLIQFNQMVEALTTKSGDIPTSTVETMMATNKSTILEEHTTVIDSTSSDSQLIHVNHETVEQNREIDTNLTREVKEMLSSLNDKPTNNEPN